METEIKIARMHINDYFWPNNVESYAIGGALYNNAIRIRSILYQKSITTAQLNFITSFISQISIYKKTSNEFSPHRNTLITLHEKIDELYKETKQLKQNNSRNSNRKSYNTIRLNKLKEKGTIYPYHFIGLNNSCTYLNNLDLEIDLEIPTLIPKFDSLLII